ncbi:anti-sigma factor antagonist [Streptomyces spinoverrucosus]|uniref:anti-sigma factor antagonist n=1 Tax=Streptomyces spinoverrucosus TaxID=284043 RepID=UPI0018C40972|nr:anti-sigma factor antagonist [Streptomyces spinoverrucosus]MBG0850639.1 anti-sigma factor antagonist [Streptomyces spinoverrucosus]
MPEPAYSTQPAAPAAVPPRSLSIATQPDGARSVVVVRGELDLQAADELSDILRQALKSATEGIDLDMGGVTFCDCSALNVLLAIREQALADGRTVTIESHSLATERLLSLTGTLSLFTAETDDGIDHELGVEVVQLRRAMQTRPTIDLARGVLMATFGLSPQDAWHVLVMVSQNTNTKLHRLAQDLVSAVKGEPLPDSVQRQVAAAVARLSESDAPGAQGDGEA